MLRYPNIFLKFRSYFEENDPGKGFQSLRGATQPQGFSLIGEGAAGGYLQLWGVPLNQNPNWPKFENWVRSLHSQFYAVKASLVQLHYKLHIITKKKEYGNTKIGVLKNPDFRRLYEV